MSKNSKVSEVLIEGGEDDRVLPVAAATRSYEMDPAEAGKKVAELITFEEIVTVAHLPKKQLEWPGQPGKFIVIRAFTRKQSEDIRRESFIDDGDGNKVQDKDLAERLTFMRAIVQPTLTKAMVDRIFLTQPTWAIQTIFNEINKINREGVAAREEAKESFRAQPD